MQCADSTTGQTYAGKVDGTGREHLVLTVETTVRVPHGSFDFSYTTEGANGTIVTHHVTFKASWRP